MANPCWDGKVHKAVKFGGLFDTCTVEGRQRAAQRSGPCSTAYSWSSPGHRIWFRMGSSFGAISRQPTCSSEAVKSGRPAGTSPQKPRSASPGGGLPSQVGSEVCPAKTAVNPKIRSASCRNERNLVNAFGARRTSILARDKATSIEGVSRVAGKTSWMLAGSCRTGFVTCR